METLISCDENKKSIFEVDALYRCNSLDKNTTFPPKQRSKSPSRQSEKREDDQHHVHFAEAPSLEFHIPDVSEDSEERDGSLPFLCSKHPKPILKKTAPRKSHACTIIVYGEWGRLSVNRINLAETSTLPNHEVSQTRTLCQQLQGTWLWRKGQDAILTFSHLLELGTNLFSKHFVQFILQFLRIYTRRMIVQGYSNQLWWQKFVSMKDNRLVVYAFVIIVCYL